jgi:hypothetical protein
MRRTSISMNKNGYMNSGAFHCARCAKIDIKDVTRGVLRKKKWENSPKQHSHKSAALYAGEAEVYAMDGQMQHDAIRSPLPEESNQPAMGFFM